MLFFPHCCYMIHRVISKFQTGTFYGSPCTPIILICPGLLLRQRIQPKITPFGNFLPPTVGQHYWRNRKVSLHSSLPFFWTRLATLYRLGPQGHLNHWVSQAAMRAANREWDSHPAALALLRCYLRSMAFPKFCSSHAICSSPDLSACVNTGVAVASTAFLTIIYLDFFTYILHYGAGSV